MSTTFFVFLFLTIFFCVSEANVFRITNRCSYTVWAAAGPGGGKQLQTDETWVINVANDPMSTVVIWGRTKCTFNATAYGSCETGDCKNQLECKDFGTFPITQAEFALNQYQKLDVYNLALVTGFNIPMEIRPYNSSCREVECAVDFKAECPVELRAKGGCQHPCTVFHTDLYCCYNNCTATYLSDFFKKRCPEALCYANDGAEFTCATGSDYLVLFCPPVSFPSFP